MFSFMLYCRSTYSYTARWILSYDPISAEWCSLNPFLWSHFCRMKFVEFFSYDPISAEWSSLNPFLWSHVLRMKFGGRRPPFRRPWPPARRRRLRAPPPAAGATVPAGPWACPTWTVPAGASAALTDAPIPVWARRHRRHRRHRRG